MRQAQSQICRLDETGEGVRLTFADGASVTADAVIGADGIHSLVRDILFDASPVSFTGGSPTAPPIPPRCSVAQRSTIAPNGGARTATSSSITSSRTAARSISSPASRSRISVSSPGRRRATSGNCARRSRFRPPGRAGVWPHAPTCTNGRSSIAIRWSAGRIATSRCLAMPAIR
jgi:2-polyprenyl-6-methoxyphenol hydroxylase-like FAD-dependent oxidoreductase